MTHADLPSPTRPLEVVRVPCLNDNYGWLLHCHDTGETAMVDTPETAPLMAALEARGWRLTAILNTHHHPDHAGNNEEIKAKTGCTIVGPAPDRDRIPGIDRAVDDGDTVRVGRHQAEVWFTPGHTRGHIVFSFTEDRVLCCGDTLFSMGCGRLFEGTPAQMWASLSRIRELPDDTAVCCAHEYTLANARFALSIDGHNAALVARAEAIRQSREEDEPTVPFLLGEDKATNPFLRADAPEIAAAVDMVGADPAEVFGEVRRRKDGFRG